MNNPKQVIQKIIAGVVLIAIAAVVTMFIKESLDTQDPESSLPIIQVQYNGMPMTDVYRAGYEWSFFTTVERRTPELLLEDIPLVAVDVLPQAPLQITFSKEPSELKVMRATGRYSTDFMEITDMENGTLKTPAAPGIYVYRVSAHWTTRGYIQYYFALQVKEI